MSFSSARDAVRAGLALVPEERQRQGLFFNLTLRHNLVLASCAVKREVLVHERDEIGVATGLLEEWRIKAAGVDATPDSLSGGNQQKVVLAKWLAASPRVLLLDEPTKGVDVGAKFEIHEMIRRQAANGLAVLVVSSDLPEILALAHRVLVMKEGALQGELPGHAATEEAVMHLATHDTVPSTHQPAPTRRSVRSGRTVKQFRGMRELSTVAILIAEVLFFAWYLWPEAGRAHPFLNAENAVLILKYLIDLRHRRRRRGGDHHLRRHRPLARGRDRARGRRHRPLVCRRSMGRSRPAPAPAFSSVSPPASSRQCWS